MRSPTRYFLTTDQDAVPDPILSHRRSSLHDHPDAFVAQNDARFGLRHVPSQNVKVRPADRRLMDPDDYVRRKLQLWPRHSHPFRGFAHSLIHVRHHRARAVVDAVTPRLAHRRRLGLGFGRHHARTVHVHHGSHQRDVHSAQRQRERLLIPIASYCSGRCWRCWRCWWWRGTISWLRVVYLGLVREERWTALQRNEWKTRCWTCSCNHLPVLYI